MYLEIEKPGAGLSRVRDGKIKDTVIIVIKDSKTDVVRSDTLQGQD